jgi:DNA polymerase IV
MRAQASILHLDLDAFFAAVEQRDKPSLRGRPVVVGGLGQRGVVSTASYEARRHGVGSAMPMHEARRRSPHAAFLAGRFDAYRQSSRIVMALLSEYSPLVEPMSLDEAFIDLAAGGHDCSSPESLAALAARLRAELRERTEGLSASVGIASSKFMAKVASELAKPDGVKVVAPGTEVELLAPLPVRTIPGVGPATHEKLIRLGITTVTDLQQASEAELVRELGQAAGRGLHQLAFARDDRGVEPHRDAKSISVEDTFETDVRDHDLLAGAIDEDSRVVVARLQKAGWFARTITLKIRLGDFTTWTRSRTLLGATDSVQRVQQVARGLLADLDLREGVRLLGVGVSNFTLAAQEELFSYDEAHTVEQVRLATPDQDGSLAATDPGFSGPFGRHREASSWQPGADIDHALWGRGWVWGSGAGVVTVRFETRGSPRGPVRSFAVDDPLLSAPGLLEMRWEPAPE